MKRDLLEILECPQCKGALALSDAQEDEHETAGEIEAGRLHCSHCDDDYPITRGIARFAPESNYADGFGMQWNRFRKTQLDSHTGHPISKDRFFEYSGWTAEELAGKRVLDIGYGAGRFTEIALSTGADVVALDYSSAVDACYDNHAPHPRLNVVQGDIYSLPFALQSFDYVYCLGVVQHTPDVEGSVKALPAQLKSGGKLVIDCYPWFLRNVVWPKYWLRPLTRRVPPAKLFGFIEKAVPMLLPLSRAIGRIPKVGQDLKYMVPVVNYEGVLPLDDEQIREWAILDTFDMFSPAHDHPQRKETLKQWLEESGVENIEIFRRGFFVARGTMP